MSRVAGSSISLSARMTDKIDDLPFAGLNCRHPQSMTAKPLVQIEYCTQCRWLLRAAWLAQELLTTFESELGGVSLLPGTGGIFEVRCGGQVLWSRKTHGRFPEAKELKQAVRDVIAPGKPLGHSDAAAP